MPIGITVNVLSVLFGGLIGGFLRGKISDDTYGSLTIIFGFSSISIGIPLIAKAVSLAPVVLSLVVGTALGGWLRLEDRIGSCFLTLNRKLINKENLSQSQMDQFLILLILCCTSGTGIFGSLQEGLSGDPSILLVKSILDFFTLLVFASNIGKFAAVISVPQAIIFYTLFFTARLIAPLLTADMTGFSAVGGFISLMTGFRMLKLIRIRIMDSLPALILIFPVTFLFIKPGFM